MVQTLSGGSFVIIVILAIACIALLMFNARKEIMGSKKEAQKPAPVTAAPAPAAQKAETEVPIPVLAAAAYYISTERK